MSYMGFYGTYFLATIMGLGFVFFSEEEPSWRIFVALYVACFSALKFDLFIPMHWLMPLIMECALVIGLVLYLKVKGYWFE